MGVFLSLWGILRTTDLMPAAGTFEHLLWTLMFMKIYGGQKPLSLAGGMETFWKWTWVFIDAITSLEPLVLSLSVLHILFSHLLQISCETEYMQQCVRNQ